MLNDKLQSETKTKSVTIILFYLYDESFNNVVLKLFCYFVYWNLIKYELLLE